MENAEMRKGPNKGQGVRTQSSSGQLKSLPLPSLQRQLKVVSQDKGSLPSKYMKEKVLLLNKMVT